MRSLYAPIDPYATGRLAVGGGHEIAWEASGTRTGIPVLVVHGGPGQGSTPGMRRYFDPTRYLIVQFDQRGCGASTPHAGDPVHGLAALETNTLEDLIADVEGLRVHLGVERWVLFGGSWGCVLSLAYAERHPERVSGAVLFAIATGRRAETDLLTRGMRGWFPDAWTRFTADLDPAEHAGDIAAAFAKRLASSDRASHDRAARTWCSWEDAMLPMYPPHEAFADPTYRLAWARLVTHYWRHGSWLEGDQLIRDAGRLAGIPCALVQGILDPGNLVGTPWLLAAAWPGTELILVDDAGHGLSDVAMVSALVTATDGMRDRC